MIQEKKFKPKSAIMLIDAQAVAGIKHLKACILNSIKAFTQKNQISKSLNVEILLYLSGYRQISKAIERIGISTKTKKIICIQITKQKKEPYFDFKKFLLANDIQYSYFKNDIDQFSAFEPKSVMKILEITDENIETLIEGKNNIMSREDALELLAIEKSALLNLIK
jgi:KEOPS complex subunit Cgi121